MASRVQQGGVTLIELMVATALGLVIVLAALMGRFQGRSATGELLN